MESCTTWEQSLQLLGRHGLVVGTWALLSSVSLPIVDSKGLLSQHTPASGRVQGEALWSS